MRDDQSSFRQCGRGSLSQRQCPCTQGGRSAQVAAGRDNSIKTAIHHDPSYRHRYVQYILAYSRRLDKLAASPFSYLLTRLNDIDEIPYKSKTPTNHKALMIPTAAKPSTTDLDRAVETGGLYFGLLVLWRLAP